MAANAAFTVLVVDDDADVLRATERILRDAGFHVVTGTTAAAALELTQRHHPALVLLDVMLPDGNGVDVARQLKSDPALADVFVILCSGMKTSGDDQAKGLAKGLADGYLTRPFSKPELLARIDAFLRIRETQRALRASEQRYRLLIENSHDIIYMLTAEGVFTFVSPAWTVLLGHPVDRVAGQPFQQFVHPDDLAGCMGLMRAVIETGLRHEGVEYRVRHLDGSWRWHTSSAVPVRDLSGGVVGFQGIARDITERRRAQAALTHSHDLMRYIIEHNRSAVAVHDRDLKYIYVSQRYLNDYGVKEHDVIGKLHYEVFPDLPQKWRDVHQRALAGETSSAEDDPYVREDGSVDWTRWECRPWYEADGSIGGIIVYTEVITERKRTEEALRLSREQYRALVENLNDVIFTLDLQGACTYVSPAVERLTGYTSGEVEGSPFSRFVHPDDLGGLAEAFMQAVSGITAAHEFRLLDKTGAVRWVVAKSRLVADDGSPPAVAGIMSDVTESRLAEQQLRERSLLLSESQRIGHIGTWSWELPDDHLRWSDEAYRIYGVSSRTFALTPASFFGLLHPDDRALVQEWVRACRSGEEPLELEFRIVPPDGDMRTVSGRGALLPATDSAPARMVGTVQDITARKHAEERLIESLAAQQAITQGVIAALARSIEVRDPYTAGHQRRVGELAAAMALRMELGEERAEGLRVGGLLHDVGKINIPAEILAKPGLLTTMEYELIKGHARAGYDILAAIHFPWPVAEMALQHHERADGSGYPGGLSGEDILPEARILAVADVVEAMASHRPYRAALGLDAALAEVRAGVGVRYDPAAVAACEHVFAAGFVFSDS